MANIVLVTKQCYLICESINYIAVHEANNDMKDEMGYIEPRRKHKRKKLTAKQKLLEKLKKAAQCYQVTIDFVPVPNNYNSNSPRNHGSDGSTSVSIPVRGYERCLDLYKEMISQIREQQPDKFFLDKMVEKFLADHSGEEA